MGSSRNKSRRRTHNPEKSDRGARQASGDFSAGRSSRRKFLLRAITVGIVLLIAWGIPELIVRIANPPLEEYRAIKFGNDPNSSKLFMKDWRLHWKLRPAVTTSFRQVSVRTDQNGFRGDDPVPGRRTVLCLGDSTVFGYRVEQSESFSVRLQARLNDADKSGKAWSVINAGVPGYTSFQTRLLAERLIPRWRPDVIVVCVGNNEAWPVQRSDRQIDADRALSSRLVALLSNSRFFLWAAEKLRAEQPQPFIAPALETAVPRVTRDEFGENLRELVRIARAANAKVALLTPPVNLYWPPARFDEFPGWEQWQTFYKAVETARNAGDRQKALEMVDTAQAENPDSFYALWIKGVVLADRGDVDGGQELLEQAIEHHSFPENCPRSYRKVVAEIARQEETFYVDVNDLFRRRASAPTSQHLYIDWCHPTPQGHSIIADVLFETLTGAT